MRGQDGVTLTELVVVTAILLGMAAASLPFLGSFVPDLKTRGAAEQVTELLRTGRQNAISTTATYRVIFQPTQIQVICTDNTPAGNVCPPNRPADVTESVAGGATLTASPSEMRFDPKGAATTGNGNVQIAYPGGGSWRVEVNPPGRVRACEGTSACP